MAPGRSCADCYGGTMARDHAETPVVLSRIYTRTGDDGTTALGDGSRAAKTDPRLAAYADVDEANCAIGVAITLGGLPDGMPALLARIQNELFDVGADLCNPVTAEPAYPPLRITESYVTALEQACDAAERGPAGAAQLRPARRHAGRGAAAHGQDRGPPGRAEHLGGPRGARRRVNPLAARYLNRLSDLLFILARRAAGPAGDAALEARRRALKRLAGSGGPAARLQPGQEAGQGALAHGQFHRAGVSPRAGTRPRPGPRRAGQPPSPAGAAG